MKTHTTSVFGFALAAVMLSTIASSCTDGKSDTPKIVQKSAPVPVKILELSSTESGLSIRTSGRITTDNETYLSFKVGGVVERVFVQEGDAIRKGQVLATIDPREINSLVAQAKLGYEKSQRDFTRVERLFADSVVTLEQVQNARTALDVASEQLHTAEFNKQFSKIIAPENGFVLKKFVNPGQVVGIGDPIVLANGASENSWILKVNASDRQWATIRLNDKAEVHLDAFPGETFQAKVLRKSETSDAATGTFVIDLLVNNHKAKFASGMFANAVIYTGKKSNTWNVPYEAVLDADGNEGFVFITSDNKTAVKQPVTLGEMAQNHVAITSGLENARAIIVSGSAYLTDKSEITIIK
ncbi:MAG TPA: efflux RND transporter periplasmic adaptor subunit [Chryseosolibacter sp.]